MVLTSSSNNRTVDEPWTPTRPRAHWYNVSSDFALRSLAGSGKCLVIGSPLFEASELADVGWAVTYLDVREIPLWDARITCVQSDARALPFPSASFDAVSTACVLCHAGMERYGDARDDDADEMILAEIARVLKPGASAAVTFGPVAQAPMMMRLGDCQRIYTLNEAQAMAARAGLSIEGCEVLNGDTGVMSATAEPRNAFHELKEGHFVMANLDYLSMLLRK